MQFTDAVTVEGKPRRTADGYLIAAAKCVRTGIQIYLGDEVGKPDMKVVRVYRAADQVSDVASLQTFSHAPITVDHPAELVTSENVKDLAVGEVSTAAKWDGEWVTLPLIVKDAAAIQSVEAGKRELSAGYTCDLDFTPGVTADGHAFDAQQKNIKINHLALVDRARAGSKARIGDGVQWGPSPIEDATPEKEPLMTLKTVTVDGIPIEVTDQGATVIATLQQRIADAAKTASETATSHATLIAAKDKDLATKDAEIDGLKAKVLDAAAIDKLVADRADLIAKVRTLAKDVKTDGVSDTDLKKAVVVAVVGDSAKDKPAAYIDARFDILVEDAVAKAGNADPFRDVVKDGLKPTGDAATQSNDAFTKSVDDLNAWRKEA